MKTIKYLGVTLYVLAILASAILLIVDPTGLDVRPLILPVVAVQFISALGFSHPITSKNASKTISYLGTVLLAIMFAALAFFAIAAVAWFVAASK